MVILLLVLAYFEYHVSGGERNGNAGDKLEIHSGGRYLITTSGAHIDNTFCLPNMKIVYSHNK